MRLWRNEEETPEGKFPIVLRRDGSVVEGRYFVMRFRDPYCAPALRAYADAVEADDMELARDVREQANEAERTATERPGSPLETHAEKGRTDDQRILAWSRSAGSESL